MRCPIALLVITAGLTACAASIPQGRFARVRIRALKVAGKIHVLFGAGGDIGVSAGPNGVLIVDDQLPHLPRESVPRSTGSARDGSGTSSTLTFTA